MNRLLTRVNMNVWLIVALVSSIGIVFVHDSPLYEKPELWSGAGRLFDSLYDLAISYVMSYIFFLIAFIPDRRKKAKMRQAYMIYVNEIVRLGREVKDKLTASRSSGDPVTNIRLLRGNMPSPVSYGWDPKSVLPIMADGNTFLGKTSEQIQTAYISLGPYMLFMETHLITKVSAFVECKFCQTMRNNLKSNFIADSSMDFLANDFEEFLSLLSQL